MYIKAESVGSRPMATRSLGTESDNPCFANLTPRVQRKNSCRVVVEENIQFSNF